MPADAKRKGVADGANDEPLPKKQERTGAGEVASKRQEKMGAAAAPAATDCAGFRDYGTAGARTEWASTVEQHYWLMRTNHTVEFADRMRAKFSKFEQGDMEIWQAFEALGDYVDSADP
jgi:hypothetical protein